MFTIKKSQLLDWIPRLLVAGILLQTLFFKFTGAPESVYIFQQLGAEPWGRIGSGIVELFAAGLILLPRTAWLGALLALGVISGAILTHLFVIGIVVMDDGGTLFTMALLVFAGALVTLLRHRAEIPFLATGTRSGLRTHDEL
jgi:uncharacterized membrane protein YphA (DoxX/SURF4 family)